MEEIKKIEIKRLSIEQATLDDLSNAVVNASEIINASFQVLSNVALSKHSINGDYDEWKKAMKIERTKLKQEIEKSVKNSQVLMKKTLENTIKDVNIAILNIGDLTKSSGIKTTSIIGKSDQGIRILGNKTLSEFDKKVATVYRLQNQKPLFDAILQETQTGIDEAPTKIYSNGREVSFKSYMEMNVRTTVRQEANELLFKASKANGVVFYICSYFGDCAKDHADYQGLYYYDEDWESFGYDEKTTQQIRDFIDSNNLISYQQVIAETGLTIRPNCRHTFRPVVLDDILEGKTEEEMLDEYGIKKGTYNDDNYIALQEQRRNERNLRFYKTRLEQHKLQAEQNPTDIKLKKMIERDQQLIQEWEEKQKLLLKEHKFLKRDKRREENKVIVQDLGAGYQLGLKIDGRDMYIKERYEKPVKEEKPKVEEEPVAQGKNYGKNWKKTFEEENGITLEEWLKKENKFEINAIIKLQHFDGKPQIVSLEEFEKLSKKVNFIGKRTFSANTLELANIYDEMLRNGEFYVDCSEGGSQYGQGCYCAGCWNLENQHEIEGINKEMQHYQTIGVRKGNNFAITETFTITEDAKVIKYNDIIPEYGLELLSSQKETKIADFFVKPEPDMVNKAKEYFELKKQNSILQELASYNPELEEQRQEILKRMKELRLITDKNGLNVIDYYNSAVSLGRNDPTDAGVKAVSLGYDVINAEGHGDSESYTIILNRTKLIILEEKQINEN